MHWDIVDEVEARFHKAWAASHDTAKDASFLDAFLGDDLVAASRRACFRGNYLVRHALAYSDEERWKAALFRFLGTWKDAVAASSFVAGSSDQKTFACSGPRYHKCHPLDVSCHRTCSRSDVARLYGFRQQSLTACQPLSVRYRGRSVHFQR